VLGCVGVWLVFAFRLVVVLVLFVVLGLVFVVVRAFGVVVALLIVVLLDIRPRSICFLHPFLGILLEFWVGFLELFFDVGCEFVECASAFAADCSSFVFCGFD